jgi:hypothetical protein
MKEIQPKNDLEIRRFIAIYKTFIKMNDEQRERALKFLTSKYYSDKSKSKNP